MKNKLCVITGANSGIGKATAMELARQGAYVVMVCRNESRAQQAKEEIVKKTGTTGIEIVIADLALQYDVRQAAETINRRFDHVDRLINNAGIYPSQREETPDGIERTFAINHLGPFLLTNLLMDALISSGDVRVINVSSEVHRAAATFFDLDNLMLEEDYMPMKAYGLSKLCNIMFTHELAKRTADTNLQTFSLHPGVVNTQLASEAGWLLKLAYFVGGLFMRSPRKGAETPIYLATSEGLDEKNGLYFKNKKVIDPADIAYDDRVTERLWEISEELTGLK